VAAIAAIAGWDTPALSNALERLELRPRNTGFSDGSIGQISGSVMAGVAVTARLSAREPGQAGVPITDLCRAIIAASGPPIVVIQDDDDPSGAGALLGEVTGTLFSALHVVGLLTNGRVRDVDALTELGLAVHAAGLCVSHSYVRLTAVNVVVRVAGLEIAPGDVLHADQHGVLQVPREALDALPGIAAQIQEREQETVRWARSEQFSPAALLARPPARH
jgi:4-hydroxy-4-methyl-2-oxoglutarate aldolase